MRAAIFAIPLIVGFLAGAMLAQVLPEPTAFADVVMWWIVVIGTSSITATLVDRWARGFLPLSWLLRMTMLFPDEAPSRFNVARRSGNVTELKRRVAAAQEGGDTGLGEVSAAILALATQLSNHDRKTRGHSERTRAYTDIIAEEMGISRVDRDKLRWAALLHDVGKLEVDSEILNKDGKLDDDEWHQIRRHPIAGMQLVAPLLPWMGEWGKTIEHHHERWDGTGYPYGLAGTEISLGARIVAVADAFDVMTAGRAYQAAKSPAQAREEIATMANKQFDPTVVRALMSVSLGRLRWVAGPMAGVLQVPFLRGLPAFGRDAATLVTSGALMTTTLAAGVVAGMPTPPPEGWFSSPGSEAAATLAPPDTASGPFSDSTDPIAGSSTDDGEDDGSSPTTGLGPGTGVGRGDEPDVAAGPDSGVGTVTGSDGDEQGTGGPTTPSTTQPGDPIVTPDSAETIEDVAVVIDVLQNDRAARGALSPQSLRIVSTADLGTVLKTGPSFRYTPAADRSGSDGFTYEVCDEDGRCSSARVSVSIAPVNDAPVLAATDATVAEDAAVEIPLTATDVEGDALTCALDAGPASGAATVDSGCAAVRYTPAADFNGTDSVTVSVSDGTDATSSPVSITVTPVNDPPVANPDVASTPWNAAVSIPVLANDTDVDGDALTARIVRGPATGSASVSAAGITYVPVTGSAGDHTFEYEACDGAGACDRATVRVTVTGVMVAANDRFSGRRGGTIVIDPLMNDVPGSGSIDRSSWRVTSGPAHGTARIIGARIQYRVDRGFIGSDSFTYTICDTGGTCDVATVTIVIE